MKHLLIDTATRFTHLALCEKGKILHSYSKIGLNFQSEEALPLLIKLLEEAKVSLSSLEGLYVGIGPGSFTGTRVGATIGKTLGFSRNLPCVPFCSLQCYEPLAEGEFRVVTDGKNKKAYCLRGKKRGSKSSFSPRPELSSYEDINCLKLKGYENILLIDPIGDLPEDTSWKINLQNVAETAFQSWEGGAHYKAQEISILYLRNQSDL